MIFSSILPACATSEMPLCYTNDDIEQSPAQGGIAVEGDLEQLSGESVRSVSLSVRQRADGVCQLLQRGLNS